MDQSWLKRVRDYSQLVLVAVLFAFLLKACVVEAYRIPSGSMEKTLLSGDFVLVNKFVYGSFLPHKIPFLNLEIPALRAPAFQSPGYGDVVVYEQMGVLHGNLQKYVKRCIALPGDTLVIRDKVVFVNHRQFPLPTMAVVDIEVVAPDGIPTELIFPPGTGFNEDNYGPIRIPRRGDRIPLNIGNLRAWRSLIEREGHTITITDSRMLIDGAEKNEYMIERNYYFMMGDNRDNSLDSRFTGFVPAEDIIGKAMLIYWSIDRATGDVRWSRVSTLVH